MSHDTQAVSAVISVILMVAIAVVLSASVFMLVSNLNNGSGGQGPKVSAVSDSSTTSSSWNVKIVDATKLAEFSDFQFAIATGVHGTIVVNPTDADFDPSQVWYADTTTAGDTIRTEATTTEFAATSTGYRITFIDASGDAKFGTLDAIKIVYDSSTANNGFGDPIPTGNYRLDIRHTTTDSVSGSAKGKF